MTSGADRSNRGWAWPLVPILVAPIITIPATWLLTGLVMSSGACVTQTTGGFIASVFVVCQDSALLFALAPGVLNLLPIFWLRSSNRRTRTAAIAASALGLARLVVPAGALILAGPTEEFGTWFSNFPSFPSENSGAVFAIGACLWSAGVIAMAILSRLHPSPA
jgi:hypothetical protein